MDRHYFRTTLIAVLLGLTSLTAQANPDIIQTVYSPTAQSNLFGRAGMMSRDISAFTKFTHVIDAGELSLQSRQDRETVKWLSFLDSLRGYPRDYQVAAVNDYLNRIRYISDMENYGQQDYWATPEEFLVRGGDCEDYAMAKYASLKLLGFDSNQMRVVILFDQDKRVRHAVLAIGNGPDAIILDNQNKRILAASTITHYKPIYAISQTGWWRYI